MSLLIHVSVFVIKLSHSEIVSAEICAQIALFIINPNWNVYLINRSVNVAMSVDKSKVCHVWLDFGSVPTPESVSASNFTPGTDSTCFDAINTVSPDNANQNRAFGTCGGSGTRTGTVPPLMLGQKWSSPSPEHLNRSTGRSNKHLKHLETSEGLQPMQ